MVHVIWGTVQEDLAGVTSPQAPRAENRSERSAGLTYFVLDRADRAQEMLKES